MKFLENVNFKKSAVFSGCALCFAVLNGYIFFPKILEFMLKRVSGYLEILKHFANDSVSIQNLQLKQGSQMRVLFDRIPFPLEVKVYLFNLTNPNEVMNGGRPHLQEIGPYIFE